MKCPDCNKELKEVMVVIEDAKSPVKSLQCEECGYVEFDQDDAKEVVEELRLSGFKERKEEIIELPNDQVGIAVDKDIVKNLHLTPGKSVWISTPSNKRIVIRISDD